MRRRRHLEEGQGGDGERDHVALVTRYPHVAQKQALEGEGSRRGGPAGRRLGAGHQLCFEAGRCRHAQPAADRVARAKKLPESRRRPNGRLSVGPRGSAQSPMKTVANPKGQEGLRVQPASGGAFYIKARAVQAGLDRRRRSRRPADRLRRAGATAACSAPER